MDYELTYAHTLDEGAALAERINSLADQHGTIHLGFDTEFSGVELGRQSSVARAKVHFASLAWDPGGARLHPRGFPVPAAAVVSRAVVTSCPEFRKLLEDPRIYLLAHNAPVDAHSIKNEGIDVANIINTLTMARWAWPGRARAQYGGGGFTLDALGKDVLGEGKLESFTELFSETVETWFTREITVRRCACGVEGCRKRTKPVHEKLTELVSFPESKIEVRKVPLEEVVPGHPLFPRALKYAAQDAVLAFALYHVLTRTLKKQERDVPWLT